MTDLLSAVAKSITASKSRERLDYVALKPDDLKIIGPSINIQRRRDAFLSKLISVHGEAPETMFNAAPKNTITSK